MPPEGTPRPTAGDQQPTPGSPLKQIRTFQGDVADALGRQNESLYSIQAQERAKSAGAALAAPARPVFLLLGGIVLILMAGAGGWYTYKAFLKKTGAPVVTAPPSRFLSAESTAVLDLSTISREDLFGQFTDASFGVKAGELKHFVLESTLGTTTAPVTVARFLDMLEASAPGPLVRALEPVFMTGSLGTERFLIFKLVSFENAFPGMLNWEKSLASDLSGLFSTGEDVKSIAAASVFKDVVYRNKDARALFLEEKPVLLYSFLDREFLIITESPSTLQAIIDRLTREKLTR